MLSTEAKGVRGSSRPSKPAIRSFAGRMVGSTPTRFRQSLVDSVALAGVRTTKGASLGRVLDPSWPHFSQPKLLLPTRSEFAADLRDDPLIQRKNTDSVRVRFSPLACVSALAAWCDYANGISGNPFKTYGLICSGRSASCSS